VIVALHHSTPCGRPPRWMALWLRLLVALEASFADASPTRLLFGSCNDARMAQPLWPHVLSRRPDVWIWGGDNIYADRLEPWRVLGGRQPFRPADEAYLRSTYERQLAEPGYAQLVNSSVPIVGTWDDHDYGVNDGDKSFDGKRWSQAAFLDFLQEPSHSSRRSQEGVYTSQRFDYDGGSVLIVLLDLRYHRDSYGTPDGDFLGEAQWKWLEQLLATSTARVHIFVSSLPVLPVVVALGGENWRRFPHARDRLLRLITQTNISAPVVLTGDVHFAQLSQAKCTGGTVLEVQSSGMTHSWGTGPPNVDNIFAAQAMHMFMRLLQALFPYRYQLRDPATGKGLSYLGLNFGELEVDWQAGTLAVKIFDAEPEPKLHRIFKLSEIDNRLFDRQGSTTTMPSGCSPVDSDDASLQMEIIATVVSILVVLSVVVVPVYGASKILASLMCHRRKAKLS